jgi:SRSO17 transposase
VAVGRRVEPERGRAETDGLFDWVAGRFARVATRRRARGFLLGLLAELPRKNCWSIAEHAGDNDSHGMRYLVGWAAWDTDGVRDDLRDYVIAGLGDSDAVLVVDETGNLKKGVCTSGCSANTPAQRGGSRTRRSRSISPTPAPGARDDRP